MIHCLTFSNQTFPFLCFKLALMMKKWKQNYHLLSQLSLKYSTSSKHAVFNYVFLAAEKEWGRLIFHSFLWIVDAFHFNSPFHPSHLYQSIFSTSSYVAFMIPHEKTDLWKFKCTPRNRRLTFPSLSLKTLASITLQDWKSPPICTCAWDLTTFRG